MFPMAPMFRRVRQLYPFLALPLTALLPVVAHAQSMVPTVIADADTGEVLQAESATRPWFPASTTKLMTAYVALREIRAGNIKLDTPIVVSPNASKQPPSKIGFKPGQEVTLENALKIMMVKSANDIAVIVAEGVGGSVPGFASMMNREAARLGMRESHFVNPHGLHSDQQITSARDMAMLARALLVEFPEYRDLWSIGAVQLGNRTYQNTNGLIGRYSGAIGMKTGFVCASGFNLVSAAERNGRTLIAVVFGATTGPDRSLKAAQLLDQGFGVGGGFFSRSGGGASLAALPGTGESTAPNRRNDICRKGAPPASDSDDFGGISAQPDPHAVDNPSRMVGLMHRTSEAASVGQREGNKITLGPRATFDPVQVYVGRKPGSTEIARRSGGTPEPTATASAFSATPRQTRANGPPLALPGVMTSPAAASRIGANRAAPARPAASASLANRPASAATRPASAPKQAIDPAPKTNPKAKKAEPNAKTANLQNGKTKAQPTAATEAAAKKKQPPKAGTNQ